MTEVQLLIKLNLIKHDLIDAILLCDEGRIVLVKEFLQKMLENHYEDL